MKPSLKFVFILVTITTLGLIVSPLCRTASEMPSLRKVAVIGSKASAYAYGTGDMRIVPNTVVGGLSRNHAFKEAGNVNSQQYNRENMPIEKHHNTGGGAESQLINFDSRREFWSYASAVGGIMVEIGVFDGDFAQHNIMSIPKTSTYNMVDIEIRPKLKERLAEWRQLPNTKFFKMKSVEAAKFFKDASVDVLYIDACHTYKCVVDDIKAWLPKVKAGGIIAGHDYCVNAKERKKEDFKSLQWCGTYKHNPKDDALGRFGKAKATQSASVKAVQRVLSKNICATKEGASTLDDDPTNNPSWYAFVDDSGNASCFPSSSS